MRRSEETTITINHAQDNFLHRNIKNISALQLEQFYNNRTHNIIYHIQQHLGAVWLPYYHLIQEEGMSHIGLLVSCQIHRFKGLVSTDYPRFVIGVLVTMTNLYSKMSKDLNYAYSRTECMATRGHPKRRKSAIVLAPQHDPEIRQS